MWSFKKGGRVLLFAIWTGTPFVIQAQVVEEWVVQYNGFDGFGDYAQAIAIDSSGNLYVTGAGAADTIDHNYATIKYDNNGNQIWVAQYDGNPGNDYERGLVVVVDISGNVYVTGISDGIGTSIDYATVKYDNSGNELWAARYNGPGDSIDIPTDLAVDVFGNVYVTGMSWGHPDSFSDFDYATVKYDSSGNELWVARYNGPGNADDVSSALGVDSLGNVYVTGGSSTLSLLPEFTTIKYDSNGNEVWLRRYNGQGGANDLILYNSSYVYVTGTNNGIFTTIKYDSNGDTLWVTLYDNPMGGPDEARYLALDLWGNVIVAGMTHNGGIPRDFAVVKYDSLGDSLWVAQWNGPADDDDILTGLAIDPMGNIAVTGRTSDGDFFDPKYDYATVKYDSDGNQLWVALYDGLANDDDEANGVVMDAFGNVYVTGWSVSGFFTSADYTTIKYSDLVGAEETEKIRLIKNPFFISPNPFWSLTTIQGRGEFRIYDISGRLRGKIEEGPLGENLESGVFFVRQGDRVVKVIKIQ